MHKRWGLAQISVYINVPFDHTVFIQEYFGPSDVIYDQAAMYMYSQVKVFFSHYFFMDSYNQYNRSLPLLDERK